MWTTWSQAAQSLTPIVQPCGCRLLHHQGPELFWPTGNDTYSRRRYWFLVGVWGHGVTEKSLYVMMRLKMFRDLWGVWLPPNSDKKWLLIFLGSSESRMNSPEPKHQHLQCLAHRRTNVDFQYQNISNTCWMIIKICTLSENIWNYITINPREKMGRNIIWNRRHKNLEASMRLGMSWPWRLGPPWKNVKRTSKKRPQPLKWSKISRGRSPLWTLRRNWTSKTGSWKVMKVGSDESASSWGQLPCIEVTTSCMELSQKYPTNSQSIKWTKCL